MNNLKNKSWVMIALVAIVALSAYFGFFPKKIVEGKTYRLDVGYYGETARENFAKLIPDIEKSFKDNGLKINIQQIRAGTTTPFHKIDWDFSMTNTMVVMMQKQSGLPVEPLTWNKQCNINAVGIILADNQSTLEDMRKKKVVLFGFGYLTQTLLKAIKDWKLEGAKLYESSNGSLALQYLTEGKVDMVISEANFYKDVKDSTFVGTKYDQRNVKILASTDYKTPCRMVSYSKETVGAEALKSYLSGQQSLDLEFLKSMELVNPDEFNELMNSFNWNERQDLLKFIKPLGSEV